MSKVRNRKWANKWENIYRMRTWAANHDAVSQEAKVSVWKSIQNGSEVYHNTNQNQWSKENIIYVGPRQFLVYLTWINSMNSIIWNYRIIFMLIKNVKNHKIIKIKKNCEKCLPKRKMAANLLKLNFW